MGWSCFAWVVLKHHYVLVWTPHNPLESRIPDSCFSTPLLVESLYRLYDQIIQPNHLWEHGWAKVQQNCRQLENWIMDRWLEWFKSLTTQLSRRSWDLSVIVEVWIIWSVAQQVLGSEERFDLFSSCHGSGPLHNCNTSKFHAYLCHILMVKTIRSWVPDVAPTKKNYSADYASQGNNDSYLFLSFFLF